MVDHLPLRGQVFFADLGDIGQKPVLIVSNNARNRNLGDVLAVRITTAPKRQLATIVELGAGEPVVGRVLCDDLRPVQRSALLRSAGGLSRHAMAMVDAGLKVALAL